MGADLRDALRSPDSEGMIRTATIAARSLDGTVSLDLGGGRIVSRCMVAATLTPAEGMVVQVMRRDAESYLVLCETRTSNPVTADFVAALSIPYNVSAATPSGTANPLVIPAVSSKSYRPAGPPGWTQDRVYQGAYSAAYGYYRGCWFYGSAAFSALRGRTCTSLTIAVSRPSEGGSGAAEPLYFARHAHAAQPGGAPTFLSGVQVRTGPGWGAPASISLPAAWGQDLIDGRCAGIGLMYSGTADYVILRSRAESAASGQLWLGWS